MATKNDLTKKYGLSSSADEESGASTGYTKDKLVEKYGLSSTGISKKDLLEKYGIVSIDNKPEDFINLYFQDYNNFYDKWSSSAQNAGWTDAMSGSSQMQTEYGNLQKRSGIIRNYLDQNRDWINPDYYDEVISNLDVANSGYQTLHDAYNSLAEYYGQWGSQEEYDTWVQDYEAEQERQRQYDLYQQSKKRLQELQEERDRLAPTVSISDVPLLGTYYLSVYRGLHDSEERDLVREQNRQRLQVLEGDIARLQAAVDEYEAGVWGAEGHVADAQSYLSPSNTLPPDGITAEDREQRLAEIESQISDLETQNIGYERGLPYDSTGNVSRKIQSNNQKIAELKEEKRNLLLDGSSTERERLGYQLEFAMQDYAASTGAAQSTARIGTPEAIEATQNSGRRAAEANAERFRIADAIEWLDYVDEYTGKKYDDNFFGQFGANYTLGRLSMDSSLFWDAYLFDPSEENRRMAETADELIARFSMVNSETLADDGTLPWISRDLANYIPQFLDQMKYKAAGTVSGAALTMGNPWGAKAGYTAGSAVYGFRTMRGAAFRELINAGIDEETARAAAMDEAFISSLIEAGDAILELATLGGGKVIDLITGGGATALKKLATTAAGKNVVTKLLAALGKYLLNAGGEYIEESTQEAVSIANQERDSSGILDLAGRAIENYLLMFADAETEEEQAKKEQMQEAGMGGLRLGLMLGGGEMVGNATIGNAVGNIRAEMVVGELRPKLQELTAKTLELNPNDKNALRVQKKLEQGKNVSGMEIYRMLIANEDAAAKKDADIVRESAAARLAELGETGDIEAIADAIARQAAGEQLRRKDLALIRDSKYGQRVVNELNPENASSGDYSSGWTQGYNDLRRQNLEYSRDLSGNIVSPDVQQITNRLIRDGVDSQEASETAKRLAEAGKIYGKQADVFTNSYLKGQSVEQYRLAFANIYQAGKDGVSLELSKDYGSGLTDAQKDIAYMAGQKDGSGSKAAKVIQEAEMLDVNAEGKTIRTDTNEDIEPDGFDTVGENGTIRTKGGHTVSIRNVAFASTDDAILYSTIAKVSSSANIANTLLKQFRSQDSLSAIDFAAGLMEAYEAGQIGEKTVRELADAEFAGKLTTGQREAAYNRGKRIGYKDAYRRQQEAKKKSGGKKEGKLHFDRKGRKFDSVRESSLAVMDTLAKALGVDIYVFESYVNEAGNRVYMSDRGEKKAPNGYYDPSDGSIHIDLNAGQSGKGTMLFTVAHELTHFIKDWSSVKYRALADALVNQYQKRGVTVSELVDNQIAKAEKNGREMSRPEAFDEVVADSMESMLTDENAAAFLEKLAKRDKGLKEKIVSWLKDLAAKLKNAMTAYKDVKPDSPEGKMVAEMEDFRKAIMGIYTSALVDAGENFRENGETDGTEIVADPQTEYSIRNDIVDVNGVEYDNVVELEYKIFNRVKRRSKDYIDFIRNNLIKERITVFNDNGDSEIVEFAREKERVKKDGAKNAHPAIGELTRAKNEIKKLVIVNAVETAEISRFAEHRDEHSHQWLDENGWEERTSYVMTRDGMIYPVTLHIAKARDGRNILYDVNVKINEGVATDQNSTSLRAKKQARQDVRITKPSDGMVPQAKTVVKQKNSDRDSDGRQLSDGQREYFKDSVVRDDDGNLIPVYHSTHDDFYTFKRDKLGRETLVNANDASLAATSLVGHWFSDHDTSDRMGGHPIKCYLKINNPYQTDLDSLAAEIGSYTDDLDKMQEHFENGQYNLVRKAAADFVRWLRFNGYDGLIVDDREFGGTSYVVLNSRQAKLTTNENPTGRNDTRFSDRDPTAEATRAALEKENGKLREDVSRLRELMRLQGKVTGGTVPKQSSVEAAAKYLNKYAGAKADVKELSRMLTDFYRFLATEKDYSWEDVKQRAMVIARYLQDNVQIKPQISEYARDVLREVRGAKITLDESQRAEVERLYGSYEAFRKAAFGNVTFVKEGGIPLDTMWKEWATLFPGTFDSEITASDQPQALIDAIDALRNSDTTVMEYAYNRDSIAQELAVAVYDSYWRVDALVTVADRDQRKINDLKATRQELKETISEKNAQINKLRSEHRAEIYRLKNERNKTVAALKQKRQDDMKKLRTDYKKKLEDTRQHYQESREKAVDSRNRAQMRKRIRGVVRELNKLFTRGTKERNVKEGMRDLVASALASAEVLFTDYYSTEDMIRNGVGVTLTEEESKLLNRAMDLLAELDNVPAALTEDGMAKWMNREQRLKKELSSVESKLKDVFIRERNRIEGTTVASILTELADAYQNIQQADESYIRDAYDENVYNRLKEIAKGFGTAKAYDMRLEQLQALYDAYKMVLTSVRNANKSFLNERAGTIEQQASRSISEVASVWGKKKTDESGPMRWLRGFHYRNLKPIYLMRAIGSQALTDAYNNVRRGEDTWYRDIEGARGFFLENARKYGYWDWDFEKPTTFSDDSGGEVTLTLGNILSLYAHSKQNDSTKHLRIGGGILEGESVRVNKLGMKVTYYQNDATSHQLGPETLGKIIGTLTKEQRAFADAMQDYLSTTMADKGNEVSLAMYGIKLFTEKSYFPIQSAEQFIDQKNEPAGEVKLKNSGFTNKRNPGSNNPMIIRDFMDVWADHVNEMSTYHAFVLAIEDFNRILNYQTERKAETAPVSLKQTIQSYMGLEAVSAVRELIQSVNGGARVDPAASFVSKGINKFKKMAVFASMSVVIQQPSAIVRAAALIDPRYFAGRIIDRERVNTTWEIIKKYAPVAGIKDMGYFDTNMGKSTVDYIKGPEHDGIKDVLTGIVKREDGSFDELLSMAPGYADKVTWCAIWEAVKRETAGKYPKLATRSEEFLQKCGDRFTEVITQTQVYDSVFARSGNMRSKDKLMGMVTSFMAEPTTSINMIYDAVLQGTRGNKAYMMRAIGAVYGAAVLNAVLKSIVYAARDDDDDESVAEKYISALISAMKDDVLFLVPNSIPFVRDIMSLIQGYSVDRTDMTLADDIISAIRKLNSDKVDTEDKILGIIGSVGNLVFPAKNMIRGVKALWNSTYGWWTAESSTAMGIRNAAYEGWSGKTVSNARQLYEARMAGDTTHEARVTARYDDQDSADSAVVSAIREAFMGDGLSEEEARKHLILYGNTDAGDAYWMVREWIYAKDKGSSDGYGKYNDLYDAILSGGDIREAVAEFTENGYDEDDVMSNVKSEVGRWFWDDESETRISEEQASDILEKYFGMKQDEIQKTILKWSMKRDTGISYEGLREAFQDDVVSENEAAAYLEKYGGMKQGEIQETILKWTMKKETGIAYEDLKEAVMEQSVSENDAISYLKKYGGMTEYDAKERVADWRFEAEHGYAYSDIKSTYLDKEITREEAIAVMTEIGGKSRDDAEKKVAYWDYEEKTGVDYENKAQQYRRGIITRQQLRQALIVLGEYSGDEADIQIEVYDWQQSGLQGASFSRVKNWHEYCEAAGVSKQMWLKIALFSANTENDKDEDGNSIRYSAMKKVMAEINKLPISKDQKTAIARAIGWSEKNIARFKPW